MRQPDGLVDSSLHIDAIGRAVELTVPATVRPLVAEHLTRLMQAGTILLRHEPACDDAEANQSNRD